jgi:aerobic-type carbon monoxide dehydrogenase small subunit (CoxS/CutS family)
MPNITELTINGGKKAIDAHPDRSLLSVLRDDLGLTGAKYGCGEGNCGACTVLVDGNRVRSCVTRVGAVGARPVRTIEGLAEGDRLHPVQEAFLKCDALQCGYCTPGMILSTVALLESKAEPTREEIVKQMNGTICRCCTYNRIVCAVETAAKAMKGGAR